MNAETLGQKIDEIRDWLGVPRAAVVEAIEVGRGCRLHTLDETLRRCPFCQRYTACLETAGEDCWRVRCLQCGTVGLWRSSDADAARSWNQ